MRPDNHREPAQRAGKAERCTMRPLPWLAAEAFRVSPPGMQSAYGDDCGVFMVRYKGAKLAVIASSGEGWEHVSVSVKHRCPTWEEMHYVKQLFWGDEEGVMQLHPPKKDYVD